MQGFGSSRSLGKLESWTTLRLARRRVGPIRISGTDDEVTNAPFYPSFDLDLPTECDDEYWSPQDPGDAFKQPPGKPSKMSYFIAYLKLSQILAFALRTIVSSVTSCHFGIGYPMTTHSIRSINQRRCLGLLDNSGNNTLSPNLTPL
jgi:hypothetical protein